MQAYRYLAKMKIMVGVTYRFDLIANTISQILVMLASVYLWNSAYANHETLEGLLREQMVTYAVLTVVLSTLFTNGVEEEIGEGVYSGSIAVYFLRPISMLGMFLANDIGELVISICLRTLPTLALGIFLFHISPPASTPALLLSLVSVVFSYVIIWLMAAVTGLISFWTIKMGNLWYIKKVVTAILSGQLIPIWFFPDFLQNILRFLPFPYTYQAPVAIYIGKTGTSEALGVIAIQLFWTVLLFALMHFVWHRGRQRVLVQGG